MKTTVDAFSYSFDPSACSSCAGKCCRGESGTIRINTSEIQDIAAYLQTNIVNFISTYLVRKDNMVTVREKQMEQESACIFFDTQESRCSIYEVRPSQCRTFPFWDHFRKNPALIATECPGIRDYD